MKKCLVVLCLVLAVGAAASGYVYLSSDERLFFSACEESLKERLLSRSTYKRNDLEHFKVFGMALEEYMDYYPDDNSSRTMIELGYLKPVKYKGYINYESGNAFGAKISGVASCEYIGFSISHITKHNVKVNGMTVTEWMSSRIREAARVGAGR